VSDAAPARIAVADFDAVVFDFDGVIIESADIKTGVFARLFEHHPDHLPEILALHERLGGISRFVKFEMIHRDILGIPYTDADRDRLGHRCVELVLDAVLTCPMVPGAEATLAALRGKRSSFVASGTPEEELLHICDRRELTGWFAEIHGSPRTKPEIVRDVCARHGLAPEAMLFIGDAWSDYEAALETGMTFLGRVPPGGANPFPEGVATVSDLVALADG